MSASAESLAYIKRAGSPIVAEVTARGGPVSIIRVSGQALDFMQELVGPLPPPNNASLREVVGVDGSLRDRALVLYFKAPRSFTGEDVIEIQCHGVGSLIESIVDDVVALGARRALPGEFSFRAVLNGKMSLMRAEKINMAYALEQVGVSQAAQLISGDAADDLSLQTKFEGLLKNLQVARGRVEAAIDFSEAEEEQGQDVASALDLIVDVRTAFSCLITNYENFCLSAGELSAVIVGEPNVGKSTLLNILSGGERALVSEIAGTTRDVIEARVRLNSGRWLRVLDTAGLREVESKMGHDQLEILGIERGLSALRRAQIVIVVEKLGHARSPILQKILDELDSKRVIYICSHADLAPGSSHAIQGQAFDFRHQETDVLSFLNQQIESRVQLLASSAPNETELLSKRQYHLVLLAQDELICAEEALRGQRPLELCGNYLRECEDLLRRAVNRQLGEEYIGEIFRQFCLGK